MYCAVSLRQFACAVSLRQFACAVIPLPDALAFWLSGLCGLCAFVAHAGLGTSSILAGVVISAIVRVIGHEVDRDRVTHLVGYPLLSIIVILVGQ